MSRALLCTAITALLATPAALAAEHANLTIYHANDDVLFSGGSGGASNAGHALVHEQRTLDIQAGNQQLRIGGLPATLDPEAVAIDFGAGPGVTVLGRRVVLATDTTGSALEGAIGSKVSVSTSGLAGEPGGGFNGTLVGASGSDLLIRADDGKVHLVHQYASVTLPPDAVSGGSSVLLDVDARGSGQRNALLTYTTSGIGWRAAYTADLAGGSACRMHFKPEASIANRSGRDYEGATIKLVAGQPNLGNRGPRMYSMAAAPAPMAARAEAMPSQASLGDYRSFTLSGSVSLPNGTVTLAPLYRPRELSCQREYLVEDGDRGFPPRPNTNDYGSQDYQDRAIASNLSFKAPEALPAGTLRAWTTDGNGAPALLGEGSVADTPKGQPVSVELGQSFELRASRERTSFQVDAKAHTMTEAYRITLSNGGETARTVTVREHPNRWREWHVTASSLKPSRQTPQVLEFQVPVPANGKATLTYAVEYRWTDRDL